MKDDVFLSRGWGGWAAPPQKNKKTLQIVQPEMF